MDYTFHELPDMDGNGKRKVYPRAHRNSRIGSEVVFSIMASGGSFGAGAIEGMIDTMTEAMDLYLTLGHSVKIKGLGTFSLALGMQGDEEAEEVKKKGERYNTGDVYIKGINFLPDARWMERLRKGVPLYKVGDVKTLTKIKSTREERLKMALEHFETSPVLRIMDYMILTGLRRTAARDELHSFANDPSSGITTCGHGAHMRFVKSIAGSSTKETEQ